MEKRLEVPRSATRVPTLEGGRQYEPHFESISRPVSNSAGIERPREQKSTSHGTEPRPSARNQGTTGGQTMASVVITRQQAIAQAIAEALAHIPLETLVRDKLVAVKPNETWASP